MGLESHVSQPFLATRLDEVISWGRKYSMWPMPFGTACCAIEFMGVVSSRFDISRFGAELVRFSPRQADLLLVMGTITQKQAPVLKQIYDQMPNPKWVLSMGAYPTRDQLAKRTVAKPRIRLTADGPVCVPNPDGSSCC